MARTTQNSSPKGITLLGLGPGDPGALTQAAWDWLSGIETLYLRTNQHPVVKSLPGALRLVSFDDIYERSDNFASVYDSIIEKVLLLGQTQGGVTYAVPGHPFVAEETCPEIFRRANEAGLPVRVIDGLSFLEPTFSALGIDPFPDLVLADAMRLSMRQTPEIPPSSPILIAQIYSRSVASDVKLTLMSVYPDEHPVRLVHGAGTTSEHVEDLALYEIDRSTHLGLLSSLFVPPISRNASFEAFQEIIARLRAPNGCPWDREQTHDSLRPFLLEEAYETLDALDRKDMVDLEEELGDLLLQIVLHAQIASENGDFNIHHVLEGIGNKLVRRHPHVFKEVEVEDVAGVIHHWEEIKAEERKGNGESGKKGLLDGVPKALPALLQAEEVIERVGRVAFDLLEEKGKPAKIREILTTLEKSENADQVGLFGELLLAVTSLAHQAGVDAESALREALTQFRTRFGAMESEALSSGVRLVDMSDEEKKRLWLWAEKEIQPKGR